MVSAQIAGLWKVYRTTQNGDKQFIAQYRVEDSAPAGGASEGAGSAVSTPEKRMTINSPVRLVTNDVLEFTFTADSAATIGTITKSIWSVPFVTPLGTKQLGRAQFTTPTPAAIALVAATETQIGGYKVTETYGQLLGRVFQDLQNNA